MDKESASTTDNSKGIPDELQHATNDLHKTNIPLEERYQKLIEEKKMSQDKLLIMKEMFGHFKNVLDGSAEYKTEPILLVTGTPGTGKIFLLQTLTELAEILDLEPPIKLAYMGIAAINIGGSTLCTFLDIPTEMNKVPSDRIIHWNTDKLEAFKKV